MSNLRSMKKMGLTSILKYRVERTGVGCKFRVTRFNHFRSWIAIKKLRTAIMKKQWDGQIRGMARQRWRMRRELRR